MQAARLEADAPIPMGAPAWSSRNREKQRCQREKKGRGSLSGRQTGMGPVVCPFQTPQLFPRILSMEKKRTRVSRVGLGNNIGGLRRRECDERDVSRVVPFFRADERCRRNELSVGRATAAAPAHLRRRRTIV